MRVWGVHELAVLAIPFSSVTSTCASPVVCDVTRNGTFARCSMVPLFALVKERSPRITCSAKSIGVQALMCSSEPSAVRTVIQGVGLAV